MQFSLGKENEHLLIYESFLSTNLIKTKFNTIKNYCFNTLNVISRNWSIIFFTIENLKIKWNHDIKIYIGSKQFELTNQYGKTFKIIIK